MKTSVVYHISSTVNLPWIVESGELRPMEISDAGIGFSCLIWATTDGTWSGERGTHGGFYKHFFPTTWTKRTFALVRLTLPDDGFLPLFETGQRLGWLDGWSVSDLVGMQFHDALIGVTGHDNWRCREEPLPLSAVLKAEARAYGGRWRPFEISPADVVRTRNPNRRGYRIGRRVFYARRKPTDIKPGDGYTYLPPGRLILRKQPRLTARQRAEMEEQAQIDAFRERREIEREQWEDEGYDNEFWEQ